MARAAKVCHFLLIIREAAVSARGALTFLAACWLPCVEILERAQPPHLISMFNCRGSDCIQCTLPRCTAALDRCSARIANLRACAEK